MRDPNRIEPMIQLLREVWMKSPDLRLAQLLVNAVQPPIPCPQIYYAEDPQVERGLRAFLDLLDHTQSQEHHGS